MNTWKLRISVDGGNFIWIQTGLTELSAAEDHCRRLYGNDIQFVGQEFTGREEPKRGGS